jgi:hypothetical protein
MGKKKNIFNNNFEKKKFLLYNQYNLIKIKIRVLNSTCSDWLMNFAIQNLNDQN